MKKTLVLSLCCSLLIVFNTHVKGDDSQKGKPEYYNITVYHFANAEQERQLDAYLENGLMPFLHKNKFEQVGVFKPIANDTASDKKIFVFFNGKSPEKVMLANNNLQNDPAYLSAAKEYLQAPYNASPFIRIETILLKAFPLAKKMNLPVLATPKSDHIYELRSYEGPTEGLYISKVKMFNAGGEIGIFSKLGFNAVFYAEVLSGCRMPNLMYMTSFENNAERDAHWKAFGSDPDWAQLKVLPEYQNNVSRNETILMHAAPYSDF